MCPERIKGPSSQRLVEIKSAANSTSATLPAYLRVPSLVKQDAHLQP